MSDIHTSEDMLRKYRALQHLYSSIGSAETADAALALLAQQCVSLTKSSIGCILQEVDMDAYKVKIAIQPGVETPKLDQTIPCGDGISARLLQDSRPLAIADIQAEYTWPPLLEGMRSELQIPVSWNKGPNLWMLLESPQEAAFNEQDLELAMAAAAHTAQQLQQLSLKRTMEWRIKQKDILIQIAQNIARYFDINEVFGTVMRQLAENFGILRGMLVLFDSANPNELSVHSAFNLTEEEMSRGIYTVGEGIIGKVVETGQAECIEDIHQDKSFLNRMKIKRRKDIAISFIAVPFRIDGQVAGVIAVEKEFESSEILEEERGLMILVASLIQTKIKVYKRITGEHERLLEENSSLKQELKKQYQESLIICKNRQMLEVLDLIHLVADSNSSIMILGESGTGKEVVAREIHRESSRREGPFVSVNCAAIPDNLLESELFGYKKGAFTGAMQDKRGKFQLANGGTLFLDEIGDMPMNLQAKLLRVIQDREVEPVGSERKEKVDIRILAATNKDLQERIAESLFREDLFYRLNVVELKLPPLRERTDDIPFLANHFIEKFSRENRRFIEGINPLALRVLQNYGWPGNVRELENVIERAILICRGNQIELPHLPSFLVQGHETAVDNQFISRWVANFFQKLPTAGLVWDEVIGTVEKELIQQSLLRNNRNKVRTADFLGINRNTLRAKMDRYNLD